LLILLILSKNPFAVHGLPTLRRRFAAESWGTGGAAPLPWVTNALLGCQQIPDCIEGNGD
jgi:hypothetical protein